MTRRFQFSLGRLLASMAFLAMAFGAFRAAAHLAAARYDLTWILALFIVACGCCGASFGCLLRFGVAGAVVGLWAGMAFYVA